MRGLFVDTAGWVACADAADPSHAGAVVARDTVLRRNLLLVTSDYVVDETLTLLQRKLSLAVARAWWEQIEPSTRLRWELLTPARLEKARGMFFQFRDKDFSFTDCTSFVIMRELRLDRVLTSDAHFQQMGFEMLP